MVGLAVDSVLAGICLSVVDLDKLARWQESALILKALLVAIWLGFAVTYSRGDAGESFRQWRVLIAIACLLPIITWFGFRGQLLEVAARPNFADLWVSLSSAGKIINVLTLISTVLIFVN